MDTNEMDEWVRWAAGGFLGFLVLVVSGVLKHLFTAVGGKANRESTNKRFDHMLDSLDSHIAEDRDVHARIVERLDTMSDRISETNVLVAKIVGEMAARRRVLGDK
jgi:hypothetical protein